jgi:hypothetical protein
MTNREWMYSGWSRGKAPSNEWIENTNNFLDRAFSMVSLVENDTIKCPCALCRNYVRHKRFDVEMHLCKHGFREDYREWTTWPLAAIPWVLATSIDFLGGFGAFLEGFRPSRVFGSVVVYGRLDPANCMISTRLRRRGSGRDDLGCGSGLGMG